MLSTFKRGIAKNPYFQTFLAALLCMTFSYVHHAAQPSALALPAPENTAIVDDEVEDSDIIPVTIMLIPSPLPRAKPPTTGKDAPPPPMSA